MPRFLPTFLAALLLVAATVQAVRGFIALVREPENAFTGPGEYHFLAPVASEFTVWHTTTSSIEGVYTKNAAELPDGTVISVRHAGQLVPTHADSTATASSGSGQKVSVLRFTAAEPGDYLISVAGLADKRSFQITQGSAFAPVFGVLGWCLLATFFFIVFLLLLILALVNVFPKNAGSRLNTK